jgi:predicted kinase
VCSGRFVSIRVVAAPSKIGKAQTRSIIYFETSAVETHRRNAGRERPRPEQAMPRMHWEPLDLAERHDLPILFT